MTTFSIHKGKLYESPNLGVGNKFYSIKSAFSIKDIEDLEYGFKLDLVTNMNDPLNKNHPHKPVISFVSKSDKRPNIYLFFHPKKNAFSLKYRRKTTKSTFKTIAQGFICNTVDELKGFLSKSRMLQDSYWDFIN